jgi:uncharacterized protein (TIGR00251 family)
VIQVASHAEGCIVSVRAQPGARRNAIVGEHNGALKVAVNAPPDKGKANDAVGDVLCEALRLKRSQVELVAGPAARDKKFLLRGVTPAAALEQIQAILQKGSSSQRPP